MINKIKNSNPLTAILLVVLFGIIGGTIAYYQSSDTFTNEFNTGKYIINAQETFESPSNWTPGDTTPKEIRVKNEGNVDAAVKVCFREKWEDENGNPLQIKVNNKNVSILNFNQRYNRFWLQDCNTNVNCFYYYKRLEPGETTEDLLESVTYNPEITFENTRTCTTDQVTHKTTCINSVNDYSGGKYTLYADIETVQYDQYESQFGNVTAKQNGSCSPLNILRTAPPTYKIAYLINDYYSIKDSELSNFDLTYATCEVVYDGERIEENKYNRCYDAIYFDDNSYFEGEEVHLERIPYRFAFTQGDDIIVSWGDYEIEGWKYQKNVIDQHGYIYNDNDNVVMNIDSEIVDDDWENEEFLYFYLPATIHMPNHDILLAGSQSSD